MHDHKCMIVLRLIPVVFGFAAVEFFVSAGMVSAVTALAVGFSGIFAPEVVTAGIFLEFLSLILAS